MVLLPADMHQDSSLVKYSLGMLGSQQLCSYFLTADSIYFKILLMHSFFSNNISKWPHKKQIKKARSI